MEADMYTTAEYTHFYTTAECTYFDVAMARASLYSCRWKCGDDARLLYMRASYCYYGLF